MASQRGGYYTSCEGKVRHATHKEARSCINRLKRLYGAKNLVIYPCWYCLYLHVGHQNPWLVVDVVRQEWPALEVVA